MYRAHGANHFWCICFFIRTNRRSLVSHFGCSTCEELGRGAGKLRASSLSENSSLSITFHSLKHHCYESSSSRVTFPLSSFSIRPSPPSPRLGVSECPKRLRAFELHVRALRGSAVYLHFQRLNSIRWAICSHSLLLPSVPLPPFFPLSLSIALYLPLRTVNVLTFHSMGHSLS